MSINIFTNSFVHFWLTLAFSLSNNYFSLLATLLVGIHSTSEFTLRLLSLTSAFTLRFWYSICYSRDLTKRGKFRVFWCLPNFASHCRCNAIIQWLKFQTRNVCGLLNWYLVKTSTWELFSKVEGRKNRINWTDKMGYSLPFGTRVRLFACLR